MQLLGRILKGRRQGLSPLPPSGWLEYSGLKGNQLIWGMGLSYMGMGISYGGMTAQGEAEFLTPGSTTAALD